ncbi:MAG: bifunctional diguanylate cyclase/phosphodiesterase [Xanthomonadaceae bacterium]|nr:bifunctional diguanylate cyclase/phosphodiesterase [Xanthomonadaceae bacterium]
MTIYLASLLIACGISLMAGVYALLSGSIGSRRRLNRAFGCLSLLLAGILLLAAMRIETDSLATARQVIAWHSLVSILVYPAGVWFIGLYCELRHWRRWLAAACVVFGSLLLLDLGPGHSLIYGTILRSAPLTLPWGEHVQHYVLQPGPLFKAYAVARDAVYLWWIGCCIVLWHNSSSSRALPLTVYLVLQAGLEVYYQHFNQDFPLRALAFVALVVLMGHQLGRELREETERRLEVEAELRHLAYHDRTTGLPNRLRMFECLQDKLDAGAKPASTLVLFNIDHFRTINESLGRAVGDLLLRAIATRLAAAAPPGSLLARDGSDDFLLLADLPAGDAESMARRIVDEMIAGLANPFLIGAHDLTIRISAGIALLPEMARDAESALQQVAVALHRAKGLGGNHALVFEGTMQAQASRNLMLERGLIRALDGDEFELYCQPQVDLRGDFIGAEALLRWRHPEHGLIMPGEFIPIAEETGLIHAIGLKVARLACLELASWPAGTSQARISINISPWQLFAKDFVRSLRETVDGTGADPRRITLELTESAFLRDPEDVVRKMKELRLQGFRLSLDDFGSGYASLANLKHLPLQEVKIDRVFIQDLQADRHDPFVEAITTIAGHLALYVVAEGVETPRQWDALAKLRCDAIQGYWISRPLPVAEFHRWLDRQRERTPGSALDAAGNGEVAQAPPGAQR